MVLALAFSSLPSCTSAQALRNRSEGDPLEFQLAEEKEPEQQADKEHYERVQILPDQTRDTGSSDGLAKE